MTERTLSLRAAVGWAIAATVLALAGYSVMASQAQAADPLPNRPNFLLPFDCGTTDLIQTYAGHNPDDKKMDMYVQGQPTDAKIRASAAGLVHEEFWPGGIEIRHGNGWFTTYMHMKSHVPAGTYVQQGQVIGIMGDVGGNNVVHLHHEQLYAPGRDDALTSDMVYPILQGEGPIVMKVGFPLYRVSKNCVGQTAPPSTYLADTYAAAPGYDRPGGTQTGTLNAGTNYVYCRRIGPKVVSGTYYNSWWLKTDLDVGPAGQWVSALYLSKWGNDEAKDNSGNWIPLCDQPYGTIGTKWNAIGAGTSVVGWPLSPEADAKKAGGRVQQFERGIILWSPDVANVVRGPILTRFQTNGGEAILGFAKSDQQAGAKSPKGTIGQFQYFQDGLILNSTVGGARWVHGAIQRAFEGSGREAKLGYPLTEEVAEGTTGRKQTFERSTIHWTSSRGTWITTP